MVTQVSHASVEVQAASVPPAVCVQVDYSPVLVLDSPFDASIRESGTFWRACEQGFEAYFESMYAWNEDGTDTVFVGRCHTWGEVAAYVADVVLLEEREGRFSSLSHRAGYGLGWLSALALVNRADALRALEVLGALLIPSQLRGRRNLLD